MTARGALTALEVTPRGRSAESARLDDYLYAGARPDRGIWTDADGQLYAVRSHVRRGPDGVLRRTRGRSVRDGDGWAPLDRQRFELHPERLVEHTAAGPLVLPAALKLGVPVQPAPPDPRTVKLAFVGAAELALGPALEERDALLLRLSDPDGTDWEQWFVRGVGEVALGRAGQAPNRWLIGWMSDRDALFAASAGPGREVDVR